MSNKLKKETKKEIEKKELPKFLKNMEIREKNRREHHIFLWLILCPPVGIYKSIKYKGFHPILNTLFSFIFLLIVSTFFILFINPYEIKNTKVEKILSSYEKYGELLEYKMIDNLLINDDEYYVYECITNLGIYNVYLNKSENLKIDYISSFLNRSVILDNNIIEDYQHQLYNEVFLFFQQEEIQDKFGTLTGLILKEENYNFVPKAELNLSYQGVHTTKGDFIIGSIYNQVIQVYDLNKKNQLIYQRKPELRLPTESMSKLRQNKELAGDITSIYGFEWSSNAIYYYMINKDGKIFQLKHTKEKGKDKYILNWGDKGDTTEKQYKQLLDFINQFESIG